MEKKFDLTDVQFKLFIFHINFLMVEFDESTLF